MKDHMMEAMKRKKYAKQYAIESDGEHPGGQSEQTGDEELAPGRGMQASPHEAHSRDALMGKSPDKPIGKNTRPDEEQGETMLGKEGGFNKELGNVSAPENSKNLFVNPKEDTHDPADLNRHRNMAGDGSNPKYDHMGVDTHQEVRHQSSAMAGANARLGERLKDKARGNVKKDMEIGGKDSSARGSGREAGFDAPDAVRPNELQQGFAAPHSKVNRSGDKSAEWDQDEEGASNIGKPLFGKEGNAGNDSEGSAMKGRMSGFKAARAKLDGFLSKKGRA